MKLPNDPRLPNPVELMRLRLTDLFRDTALAVNALIDRTDTPITPAAAAVLTGSPFDYLATVDGLVSITGGVVSAISYGRNGAFTALGITSGLIPVKLGDVVRITYTVAPTVDFIPQ